MQAAGQIPANIVADTPQAAVRALLVVEGFFFFY